jgi:hypothetical protein
MVTANPSFIWVKVPAARSGGSRSRETGLTTTIDWRPRASYAKAPDPIDRPGPKAVETWRRIVYAAR